MNNPSPLTARPATPTGFLETVVTTEHGIDVVFAAGEGPVSFSWFWLRDHGIDEASLDPRTLQRRVDTFSIPADITPKNVRISDDLNEVVIDWHDAPPTTISAEVLASARGLAPNGNEIASMGDRVLWNKHAPLESVPTVAYDAVMQGDAGLREWLENIVTYGLSLVEGVPSTEAATRALAERIGRVEETIFGDMWQLSAELQDHGDTAYSTEYLEPHTDSSYYHDAPGLQLFNCVEFNGKGGASVQVDGFAIAERIRVEDPDAYATLTEVIIPARYLEPGVHLRAERAALRLNAKGELVQVTFNNYDRAPFLLDDETMARFYHAYGLFHQHVMDQESWMKIPLRPGTALIIDNWRNLHGRMGYVGKRVFWGCYMNRAEIESKLRVMRAQD